MCPQRIQYGYHPVAIVFRIPVVREVVTIEVPAQDCRIHIRMTLVAAGLVAPKSSVNRDPTGDPKCRSPIPIWWCRGVSALGYPNLTLGGMCQRHLQIGISVDPTRAGVPALAFTVNVHDLLSYRGPNAHQRQRTHYCGNAKHRCTIQHTQPTAFRSTVDSPFPSRMLLFCPIPPGLRSNCLLYRTRQQEPPLSIWNIPHSRLTPRRSWLLIAHDRVARAPFGSLSFYDAAATAWVHVRLTRGLTIRARRVFLELYCRAAGFQNGQTKIFLKVACLPMRSSSGLYSTYFSAAAAQIPPLATTAQGHTGAALTLIVVVCANPH